MLLTCLCSKRCFYEYVSRYQTQPGSSLRLCSAVDTMQPHFPRFETYQRLFPWASSTWPPYLLSNRLNDGKKLQEQALFFTLGEMLDNCECLSKEKKVMKWTTSNFSWREVRKTSVQCKCTHKQPQSSNLSATGWFIKATTTGISDMQLNKDLMKILQRLCNTITCTYLPFWKA